MSSQMNKFYIYNGNYSELIREGLLRRENWVEERHKSLVFTNCQFIWKPCNLSLQGYTKLDAIARSRHKPAIQVFNHFENVRGICTKTGLVRSLKKYYRANKEASKVGYSVFDSIPTSFLITAGAEDHEHSMFVSRYKDLERQIPDREKTPLKHCLGNVWLVKPANLNQGRGIKVFRNLKDIHNFLNSRALHSFWVVQKYIEKPLLYNGRKFDIRVWAVVTHKNEVFMYKKAYIRTSSDSYDLNNKNNYVHLTNNCLQQNGQNYGKHEDGNTLPLEILDEYFAAAYPEKNVKLETHIMPRIKDLIIDTILSSKTELNPLHRPHIFEFFGYDFMIDEDLRTWLIEVNTNPYLGTPNEYIGNLLPKFVDDMLDITIDHLIPPKNNPRGDRPNDFEIIYCENNSSHNQGPLNVRSPFTESLYPVSELTPSDYIQKQENFKKRQEAPQKPKPLYFSSSIRPVDREPKTTREKGTALVPPTKLNQKINPNQTFPSPIPEADIYNVEDGVDNQTPTQDHAAEQEQEDLDEIIKEEDDTVLNKRSGSVPANILEEEFTDTDGDDDVLLEDELTEDSSDELEGTQDPTTTTAKKRRRKLRKSKSKKKNIESVYKSLHLACIYKTSIDINVLSKELNLVLGSLKNWELISEKKIRVSNKALKLISQSNANYLFTTPRVVDVLSRLLKSQNVGLDIKLAIVEAIGFVAKDENHKRKLIHTRIVHELIRICLYSCDPSMIQNYSKLFFMTTLKCLINLGVTYFKKPQSQQEAKEFEKLKASFMGQGAVIAIWLVAYHSLDSSLKEIAFRNFLTNIKQNTLEKQIELLDLLKIIPEADSENEDSDDEDNIGGGPSGLVSVTDMATKEKGGDSNGHNSSIIAYEAVLRTTINMRQTNQGTSFGSNTFDSENLNSISFPKSLFKLYPLEQLITEFKEYAYSSKESAGHKEFESKERQILKEIVKLIKQERKKITASSPIDANKNSCSPKMYRKLQTKMQKMKIEQQVNAYQKPRKHFSPSVEKELNLSQSTHSKRGVSHDFKKKPPRNIEKLHLGSMARGFVDPDNELKKTLYKQTSANRGTVPMPGSTTLSPAITAKGLIGHTSKPPSLTQFDIDPNFANTKSILQTRKTNRQLLPSINPARLSEKKLGSPNGNIEAKPPKNLGLLTEEGTVQTEESAKGGPKQLQFIYPTARESELRESLYGNGGKGFRSGRYDVEAVKLMNNRANFAKRPSPKRKIV